MKTPLTASQAADIKVALGRTLEKSGDLDQAQAAYLQAVTQDPHRGDAWARLGVLYDMKGNFASSAECYRKARLYQGANSSLSCNLGYSLYLQRDLAGAEMSLREAVSLDPANARAHNNLGLVLAHSGQAKAAIQEFRRAGCTEAEAHTNLALARAVEGDLNGARDAYEHATAIDPNLVAAKKGLRQLKDLIASARSELDSRSSRTASAVAGTRDASSSPATGLQLTGGAMDQSPRGPRSLQETTGPVSPR
jgi:Flp pilus assembly protein TadD